MNTVTYHLDQPMKMFNRNGANECHGLLDKVEFDRLAPGDTPPASTLVESLARSLRDDSGEAPTPGDLEGLNLEAGLKKAFMAQLAPFELFGA